MNMFVRSMFAHLRLGRGVVSRLRDELGSSVSLGPNHYNLSFSWKHEEILSNNDDFTYWAFSRKDPSNVMFSTPDRNWIHPQRMASVWLMGEKDEA